MQNDLISREFNDLKKAVYLLKASVRKFKPYRVRKNYPAAPKAFGTRYQQLKMPGTVLKEKLMEDIETLPEKKIKEVIDFIEFLKLKEDDWFINLVNKRGRLAKTGKKAGKSRTQLKKLHE